MKGQPIKSNAFPGKSLSGVTLKVTGLFGSFSFRVSASGIVEPGPSYARNGVPAALVRFLLRVETFGGHLFDAASYGHIQPGANRSAASNEVPWEEAKLLERRKDSTAQRSGMPGNTAKSLECS